MSIIKEIHQFLEEEINKINELITSSLVAEEELVQLVSNYISKSGGKRIRPLLTLLTAKMFSSVNNNRLRLAAAVEFIHMATLLHDDVVDGSKMRRFLPTANVVWGNKASILVGDFLFSQAFKLIVSTESIPAMTILSSASAIIAEGEVSQLAKLEERRLITENEYLKIINAKTAILFGAACEVGAVICNQPPLDCTALKNYGIKLGNIFQITDDLLDYFTDAENRGKNIGDDFAEGKVTLPLIFLARKLPISKKEKLLRLIAASQRNPEEFIWITDLLVSFNIQTEIIDYLESLKISAYQSLNEIQGENQSKEFLKQLIDFAVKRTY